MFDPEFYPTDQKVFDLMEVNCTNREVYDPQSGSGNLIDFAKNGGAKKVYASERNPDLAMISRSKADIFLGTDFFKVTDQHVVGIDLFLMNPPFSNAEDHIIHAWNIAPEGAEIISLFNFDSMQYGYGKKQEVRTLAKDYGFMRDLGRVFADNNQRKTDVRIGLIKLFKPVSRNSTKFEGFYTEAEEYNVEGIITRNKIDELVGNYRGAAQSIDAIFDAASKLKKYTGEFCHVDVKVHVEEDNRTPEDFLIDLQRSAWQKVFSMMELERFLTTDVMKDISTFAKEQRNVPFSKRNIFRMMEIIMGTSDQIMERALVNAVDEFTKYTHENRYGVEGWKTNEGHLLGKKFIVNYMVEESWTSKGFDLTSNSRTYGKVEDLTKVLCNLLGKDYKRIRSLHNFFRNAGLRKKDYEQADLKKRYNKGDIVIYRNDLICFEEDNVTIGCRKHHYCKIQRNTWYKWGFFEFKVFKKGTMHLKFRSEDHWAVLNRAYAKAKGQVLPEKL